MKKIWIFGLLGLLLVASSFGAKDVSDDHMIDLTEIPHGIEKKISEKLDNDIAELTCEPEIITREKIQIKKVPVIKEVTIVKEMFVEKYPDAEYYGIEIDNKHYTMGIQNDTIVKIELNGNETTSMKVELENDQLRYFFENYNEMNWVEKLVYLVEDMKLPFDFILQMTKLW